MKSFAASSYSYRAEIDGLRALAVLSVIVFHASSSTLPGGFLGVDIFFVISGFLIGSILLKEKALGTYSLRSFLGRRLRRVLPALYIVGFLCLIPGWFLQAPSDYKDLIEALFANALAVSNYLFLDQTGYFDRAAELKPLLHTWSLAVEIQFYLLVAFVVWIAIKWRFLQGAWWVFIGAFCSYVLYIYLYQHNRDASFFIFPPLRLA